MQKGDWVAVVSYGMHSIECPASSYYYYYYYLCIVVNVIYLVILIFTMQAESLLPTPQRKRFMPVGWLVRWLSGNKITQ